MKSITIDGRLGKDAEILETKNGIPYVKFSVANDSYSMGQVKTEWFDVTSFDKNVIENRIKALTKGRYVIVTGTPLSKVNITQDRKVYLNQYVTAITTDIPSLGRRNDDGTSEAERPKASTYTGGTPTTFSQPLPPPPVQQQQPQPQPQVQAAPSPQYATTAYDIANDDLPF